MTARRETTAIGTALRYWHTIRHLKPTQLVSRARFVLSHPTPELGPAPRRRPQSSGWIPPAAHRASMAGADEFDFLNRRGTLAAHGWDDPAVEKLWRYNLHYFDDLIAPADEERVRLLEALISRWIRENPPGVGTGWESYPTSLRIVNWIKWSLTGRRLDPDSIESLAVQARWVLRRLEYHLLGNHLFANAKALVFAGLFFDGTEADRWLERGLRILAQEIPRQILDDGGHFEQSPMYHALAVEDMLDLINISTAFSESVPSRWRALIDGWPRRVQQMRLWLRSMSHPDGEIGFFNDAAMGIARTAAVLDDYSHRLGLPAVDSSETTVQSLVETGYVRVEHAGCVAILDVGPVGPDYLPAHAHADALSFELSLFGQRVFVNSGTSCYGNGAERQRQRGTGAHNTVVVDGEDSSEVWSGFRVARRARPFDLRVIDRPTISIACGHDGYRRLSGRPVHRRCWTFDRATLSIADSVGGRFGEARARFHLHPHIATDLTEHRASLSLPNGRRVEVSASRGALSIEPATWHPQFGVAVPTQCIVVTLDAGVSHVSLSWAP